MFPAYVALPPRPPVQVITTMPVTGYVASGIRLSSPALGTGSVLIAASVAHVAPTTSEAVRILKATSGLTWAQIADLFDVNPRAVHYWANGQGMDAAHESSLRRIVGLFQSGFNLSPILNRRFMLTVTETGEAPIDLVKAGQFDRVRTLYTRFGATKHAQLQPLSPAEAVTREPLAAAVLATAELEIGPRKPFKVLKPKVHKFSRA